MLLDDRLSLTDIRKLPPLEWTIKDLLPRHGILLFGGGPKLGKSVNAFDTILRGLRGRPAFGKFAQSYKRALIVNIEGGHRGIKMREDMFRDLPEALQDAVDVSGERLELTLPTGHVATNIFTLLAELWKPYDVVVLDPLVSFHTADENNSQQMVALFDALRAAAVKADTSIIVVHHMRKLGQGETTAMAKERGGDMLRGAGGIFGAVDGLVTLWPDKPGTDLRGLGFSTRYADDQPPPMVIVRDKICKRLYPITDGIPDPHDWVADWGPDWQRYAVAFGVSGEVVRDARGRVEL